jgi:hypothetical protein
MMVSSVEPSSEKGSEQSRWSWRAALTIHPAADLFQPIAGEELTALGKDILENGLRFPIVLSRKDPSRGQHVEDWLLLDGRNRLAALESIGCEVAIDIREREERPAALSICVRGKALIESGASPDGQIYLEEGGTNAWAWVEETGDPWRFVISANVRRRHLTADQKRKLIRSVLEATPEKSNRSVAETVKTDDKTVASVRRELEATAEIPQLATRLGKDGKARRTARPRPTDLCQALSNERTTTPLDAGPMPASTAADSTPAPLTTASVDCGLELPASLRRHRVSSEEAAVIEQVLAKLSTLSVEGRAEFERRYRLQSFHSPEV